MTISVFPSAAAAAIEVSPSQLKQMLASGAVRVVDVREPHEWAICHIDGSELMPLSQWPTMAELLMIEPTPIVTVCHHGVRSLKAAEYLLGRGLRTVYSLRGGIDAWAKEIEPTMAQY